MCDFRTDCIVWPNTRAALYAIAAMQVAFKIGDSSLSRMVSRTIQYILVISVGVIIFGLIVAAEHRFWGKLGYKWLHHT